MTKKNNNNKKRRAIRKQKKLRKQQFISNFSKEIKLHKNELIVPRNYKLKHMKWNTWFSVEKSESFENNHLFDNDLSFEDKTYIKCKKIILKPNTVQKQYLETWFKSSTCMYNTTVDYIKTNGLKSFFEIRKKLKNDRDNIKNNSKIGKYSIYTHSLDSMIKLVVSNYKSAITNLRRGNIRFFRMRKWKYTTNKLIKIEPQYFLSNSTLYKLFGSINTEYNGKNYDLTMIRKESILKYNVRDDRYMLYIPCETQNKNIKHDKDVISIDLGLRTFITGVSNKDVIEIGNNIQPKIKEMLKYKDKIMNNKEIPKSIRKKIEIRTNRKLSNLRDELHWKTINYLTKHHKRIIIGDLNSKSIVRNDGSVLRKMDKRLVYFYSFYMFKQRLKTKCQLNNNKYDLVNEYLTTKICSNCGNSKEDVGANKTYNCNQCKIKIGRDVNSCRNIYIRSLEE
jgi:transposase